MHKHSSLSSASQGTISWVCCTGKLYTVKLESTEDAAFLAAIPHPY